ncbi:uncharacterized protein LOC133914648 [Phragmites australis]|uniref:uncharacterized protein LOC133914648 n=1 Tax=Phragmites australis TaxID=29695 RepID=UPI002D77D462|nr:uncharacterized protein LOC133914648 [Phragmites australis]
MDFVNRTWDPGSGSHDLSDVSDALMSLQSSLKSWDREVFGSVKKQVKELCDELEVERSSTLYRGPTETERSLFAKLADVLAREEIMERQRSRISWLKEGDRNTEFFQAKARARSRTNRIKVLKDSAGHMFMEQEDLERLACEFYQNLFKAQHDLQPELICCHVPRKVTPEMVEEWEKPFTEQEVETTLFQMAPNKSPGVDGFNAGFFQTHWLLVKDCVVNAVLGFLNGGDIPEEASKRGADRVATIQDDYNRGSGQLVNKQKSAIYFSPNCEQEAKEEVHGSLQIPNEALGEQYLGLPTAAGRGNSEVFNFVPARVRGFVGGWAEKNLSCAAREVLLKANAQSVPTYSMSCFKLPPVVCRKLTSYVSNYWWSSSLDKHKIHWQRWEKLTRPKCQGGIGFRDFTLFNQAMLGKQGWRLISRPESLCAKVLKGKYFPNGDFLSATRKKRSSETWRSILHGKDVLKRG